MKIKNQVRKWLGVISLLGGISAIPLMITFNLTDWGEPGTSAYQTYELLNRLMSVALLLMIPGWVGLGLLIPTGYGRWELSWR